MKDFKENDFDSFRDAMSGRQLKAEHIDEKATITVCQEYGNSDLFEMEAFVKQTIGTMELAFVMQPLNAIVNAWQMLPLARYYKHMNFFMEMFQEEFCYNPFIELFYKSVFKLLGSGYNFSENPYVIVGKGKVEAVVFNELILLIRAEAATPEFKKKVKSREYNLSRNEKSATSYIEKLFERFARLMVVRVDFFFAKDGENSTSTSEARSYISRFLNNKRSNGIFSDLVGYVWKLEDGQIRGPHFHCLFFFDGSKACKDVYAGMEIGRYWKEITDGKGQFFNVNANYQTYLNPMFDVGVGMINHYDFEKRRGLKYIVKYFFKAEQYLSAKSLKKLRTYGHGEVPGVTNSGRPRSKTAGCDSATEPPLDGGS
jgi:hypothetical protein